MSHKRFYGGEAGDLGKVRLLQHIDFASLVHATLGMPTKLNITRGAFGDLKKKERDRRKRTAYLTPCSFRKEKSRRVLDEADAVQLIFLDIDDSRQARPFWKRPEVVREALAPFNFALYATANSTANSPRLRVMVEADGDLSPDEYQDAVRTIATLLGLPDITPESLVAVQPMFSPILFSDDDATLDHPLLDYRTKGDPFTCADVNHDLIGSTIASRTRDAEKKGKSSATSFEEMAAGLEYLEAPIPEITLEVAEAALYHLDPDMSYMDWLETGMALRHQFPGRDEEEAFTMWDEWCQGGEKYEGGDDTQAKWNSITPQTTTRRAVTIRSLLKGAVEAGWNPDGLDEKCIAKTEGWIMDADRTVPELLDHGLKRIISTPFLTTSLEEVLLHKLIDACKERGSKVNLSSLRKQLRAARRHQELGNREGEDGQIAPWARGFCYVSAANEFFRPATGEKLSPGAVDSAYGRHLLLKEGADLVAESEGDNQSRPTIRPQDYLLNMAQVPTVFDFTYDPRKVNDSVLAKGGLKFVNTYVATHPDPDFNTIDDAAILFEEHLENLIAEKKYRELLLDYLCFIVQNPGRKCRWAVLLQGAQGCGKTFLAEALAAVLGKQHVKSLDAAVLMSSQWNDWAVGSQVVTIEEIRVVGHNRHEVMNKLKAPVSNDTIGINQRFRDTRTCENVTNYLMFTNHTDSLALSDGDRRYFVLRSALQSAKQVEDLGPHYFEELFRMLRKNAGGLRAYFETRKISKAFNPDAHAPRTVYMDMLIDAAATPDTFSIREAVHDSEHPLVSKWVISTRILTHLLELEGHRIPGQRMAAILREEGYVSLGRKKIGPTDNRENHTLWVPEPMLLTPEEFWETAHGYLTGNLDAIEVDILLAQE
jgi:hypothetical protein